MKFPGGEVTGMVIRSSVQRKIKPKNLSNIDQSNERGDTVFSNQKLAN